MSEQKEAMPRTNGKFEILAYALDQIHHGQGTSGNTAQIRMEEALDPATCEIHRTPFISSNSLKNMIRRAGVRFAIEAMDIEPKFSRPVIDLLMSGGALSKGGSVVKLAPARRLEALFPMLAVMGYSAGNRIEQSRLRCDDLRLVCEENKWRMPDAARELEHANHRAGKMISDGFGTRRDASRSVEARLWMRSEERKLLDDQATKDASKKTAEKSEGSNQMIYDYDVIMPGAAFWGEWTFYDLNDMELAALQAAISRACVGTAPDGGYVFEVGAMSRKGKGRLSMHFSGKLRADIRPPKHEDSGALVAFGKGTRLDDYIAHLRENRDEILATLEEVAKG